MKKSVLKQYARLIARTGANVQKGQSVLIVAGLDQPEFIELLAAECYRAGASEVEVDWRHQPLTRLAVRYKTAKKLGEVKAWEEEKQKLADRRRSRPHRRPQRGPGRPDGHKPGQIRHGHAGPLPEAAALHRRAGEPRAVVHRRRSGREMGQEGLSRSCRRAARWKGSGRPSSPAPAPWRATRWRTGGCTTLISRPARRPSTPWASVRPGVQTRNGTDLTVGLIPEALFLGGAERCPVNGVHYDPNIPSEELFITPKAGDAEGVVHATSRSSSRAYS